MAQAYFRQLKLPLEIKKSNALARAEIRVKNNPLANKLFAALVRAINPDTFPEISEIDIRTLLSGTEMEGGREYNRAKDACDVLMDAKIEIRDDAKKKFTLIAIVTTLEYDQGQIKAKFNPDLKPHLLNLRKFYTEMNFFELASLKGFYTPRLFEVLKSWEKGTASHMAEIDLEGKGGLYHSLSFPEALHNDYQNIKRILEKAHKEIIEKTGLQYSWEPIKRSRKVIAIRVYFGGPEQRAKVAKSYADRKRSVRNQSQKNNAMFKLAIACMKEHGFVDGYGQSCPDERPRLGHCKMCIRLRGMSLLTPDVMGA